MKRFIFCLVILAFMPLLSGNTYTEYFKCPENSLPGPAIFPYSSDRPMDADHVIPENGGTIGEDSFYNPTNGIIYVYGGMYLTLIDADDNSLITSLQVTNQLCKRHSSLTYPRDNNLFAYVEATNTLFCATEIGSIVVINCDTNSIESEMNDYAILNKIPSQHRLLYDNMSQTLFQYFNTDEYAGTGSARLIAYSVTSTYPYLEVKYSTPDLTGNDKIFDLILHYDTSLTGTRWLLFSTEAGDIKYINCFDDNFNNVHVAYSVTVDRQARGFCMSMDPMDPENPADDQPEILCGTYHSTECGYIRILKIVTDNNYPLSVSTTNLNINFGEFYDIGKITYIEYNQVTDMLYLKGKDIYTSIMYINRLDLSYANQFTFDYPGAASPRYGKIVTNSSNGDLLLCYNSTDYPKIVILQEDDGVFSFFECFCPGGDTIYNYGGPKYFTFIDQEEVETPTFLIPSWDGSLSIISLTDTGYSQASIITGRDYSRLILTVDGAYAISWYPNDKRYDNSPIFITETATGNSVIHNMAFPFQSIGYDPESDNIFVPQENTIEVIHIPSCELVETLVFNIADILIYDVFYASGCLYITTREYGIGLEVIVYNIEEEEIRATRPLPHITTYREYIIGCLYDEIANRVCVYVNCYINGGPDNLLLFNSNNGSFLRSVQVSNPIWKVVSDYNGKYFILTEGTQFDRIYSYSYPDAVPEEILEEIEDDALLDIEYSKTSKNLFITHWDSQYYLSKYVNEITPIESIDLEGVCTNLKMNQFTNRLYLYFPYKNHDNDGEKIVIGILDTDESLNTPLQYIDTGYIYKCSATNPTWFAWTEMQIHPETGDVMFIPDRSSTLLSFQDDMDSRKLVSSKWRWLSFPQLNREDNDPVNGPGLFAPVTGLGLIEYMDLLKGVTPYTYSQQTWDPLDFSVQSTEGIKIKFSDPNEVFLPVDGTMLEYHNPAADFDLIANDTPYVRHENWIGYWLMENQMPQDAFGDDWDKVVSIAAEDWYFVNEIITPRAEVPSKSKIRPLEYGESYVIKVREDIPGFRWGVTGISVPAFERKDVENFTYEDKSEYEVIDVLDIPSDVIEIGVFDGDTCIGAVAVQDSIEQILVYPDSTSTGDPYEFQVVTGRSIAPIMNYQVYRETESTYLLGEFGRTESYAYHRVILGDRGEGESNLPKVLTLNGNYPNPFNPETKIAYILPEKSDVKISVYNIKGQLVKLLHQESEEAGEHFVIWDGIDSQNRSCASGIYFCRVSAGSQIKTQKMLLLK